MASSKAYATSAVLKGLVVGLIGGLVASFLVWNENGIAAFLVGLATWLFTVYIIFENVDRMVVDRIKEYDKFVQMEEAGIESEAEALPSD